jgi:uncharacterized protein
MRKVTLPSANLSPVPSPCRNICTMDAERDLCRGCLRTIGEIAEWGQMSDKAKRAVWQAVMQRQEIVTIVEPKSLS